jgi:ATP-binding cassette, subfamily B, bacterial
MSHEPAPARSLLSLIARIAPHFAPHRGALLLAVLLSVLSASLAALEPLLMKQLFDDFMSSKTFARPMPPFLMLIGVLLTVELIGALREWLVWKVRLGVDFSLMHVTVDRLHSLPLEYHRDHGVGATMTRMERGIGGCMSAFSEVVTRLLPSLIYLVVSVVIMLQLEWRLGLAVIVCAPLPAIIGAWASREQTQRERGLLERWTKVFARFNEVLAGIVVVKSFVMEDQEKRRFLGGVSEANKIVLAGVARDAKTGSARNLVMTGARMMAVAAGGMLVMRGEITLGTLVAFLSYLGGVIAPVQALTGMYQMVRRASVSLEALLTIFDAQDSLGDAPDARDAGAVRGEVEFAQVGFRYRADCPVLQNVSLHVKPGELVAFVGPSGAGKTTMMALLQRLYDPSQGAIRIDGQDIRSLKQRSLRENIGVVLQDGALFSDTVRDNIAFGQSGASMENIEAAARAANAHEFIVQLPQGYDTPIGERGGKLSGGERQRIAIARALLKNAPILVLDEATSALDAESEAKVQEALARLTKGRTTFVIAHRLATVTNADRIVVFRDGLVSELGTHQELLRRNGYYASLVRRQVQGLAAA